VYYTNGLNDIWGTRVATMQRVGVVEH
jgi:hypothetical protein